MELALPYYPFLPFALLCGILLFLSCFTVRGYVKRKRIIRQIRCMSTYDKAAKLNEACIPLGFTYLCDADIFTSTLDAWQRSFGYHTLYDRLAWRFGMVFDYEPVYFYYHNKTWLIEFWKGQYGINTGAEIGIYHTDGIVPEAELSSTLFTCAADKDMLPLSMSLQRFGTPLVSISQRHWWLTAFHTGLFSQPSSLALQVCITLPNYEMRYAFLLGLQRAGYDSNEVRICGLCVSFLFDKMHSPASDGPILRLCRQFCISLVQLWNRLLCRLFLCITRPFCSTLDRVLLLELQTPRLFQRCLRMKAYQKRRKVCRKGR